jgi:hypothetical protein
VYDYDIEDVTAILLNEAEKLYAHLAKQLEDEVTNEYVSKTLAAVPSLPMLSLEDKQQQL